MKDDSNSASLVVRINDLKVTREPFILFFETHDCGVCHAIYPKLMVALKDYEIEVIQVDASVYPEIAGQHIVFTVPTVLLWAEGKEMLRESGYVDFSKIIRILELMKNDDRYLAGNRV